MKVMQHSDMVETMVTRSDFTKHGLHLNMNGNWCHWCITVQSAH
jgi:hypothetical protein